MSGVDLELAKLTEQLLSDVDTASAEGKSPEEQLQLVREFAAKVRARPHKLGISREGFRDVLLELEDFDKVAKSFTITHPQAVRNTLDDSEVEEPETRPVQGKVLASDRIILWDSLTVPVGSVLRPREGEEVYQVLKVEPVWGAAKDRKFYLCQLSKIGEEETGGEG